jgi:hypothetical protein
MFRAARVLSHQGRQQAPGFVVAASGPTLARVSNAERNNRR